jgi:hypothetical protein
LIAAVITAVAQNDRGYHGGRNHGDLKRIDMLILFETSAVITAVVLPLWS